jgi:hypothetical protein
MAPKETKTATTTKTITKPKRGPNGYMVYNNEVRAEVMKKYGLTSFGDAGKKVGELWRALSDKEKDAYKAKAALLAPK